MTPSFKGKLVALVGVLVLTPDTLFMRWSEFSGPAMVGWRGSLMAAVFLLIWAITSRDRRADMRLLFSLPGITAILAQSLNAWGFSTGVALAPVSVVLIAVATVPIWAAFFSRFIIGEHTRRATWVATGLVLVGIVIAAVGDGFDISGRTEIILGAGCGLLVAAMLALSFVVFRLRPDLPILLSVGSGAALAGFWGILSAGPEGMSDGRVWPILVCGLLILPFSFFAMSAASRLTQAANVSLIILLETMLGPVWVYYGIGEAPGPAMWIGGPLVVLTLAVYIVWTTRHPMEQAPLATG